MIEYLQEHHLLLALVIFLARIVDVSMGTVRTIIVFRGRRVVAAALGFVEILVWLSAAGLVFNNLGVWYLAVAYAGGFATGNVVGMWLEGKLALGSELVRAISENRDVDLGKRLGEHGYSVIEVAATENGSPVEVLFVVEHRRRVPKLLRVILTVDPEAVCTMSDVKRHDSRLVANSVLASRRK